MCVGVITEFDYNNNIEAMVCILISIGLHASLDIMGTVRALGL